MPYFCW